MTTILAVNDVLKERLSEKEGFLIQEANWEVSTSGPQNKLGNSCPAPKRILHQSC